MILLRIENLLLNNLFEKTKEELLKEGTIFKGKIIGLSDGVVLIDVKEERTIQATLDTDIKLLIDDEISFLVKSSKDNVIHLKPLFKEEALVNDSLENTDNNNPIGKLLKNINVKETKLTIELAENMMKHNVPINTKNLTEGVKTLEKIFQLITLKDEEEVILADLLFRDQDPVTGETNIIKETVDMGEGLIKSKVLLMNNETTILPEKVDIKNFLVITNSENIQGKDLSLLIREYLGNETNYETRDEFVKIVSFFLKNDIKPSLNNIKNLLELNKDPIEFGKNLKEIDNVIRKFEKESTDKNSIQILEKTNENHIVTSIDNRFNELKEILKEISNRPNQRLNEDIRNFENKIDFLKDLNKVLSFLFFPMNYGKEKLNGILTLIKENKNKKGYSGKINIFINVDTHNLGSIRVSCQMMGNSLSVKMYVKKEDLELFESTEKQLIEKIQSIGYSLNRIEFIADMDIQLIDTIVSNPNPTYILDVKV